MKRDAQALKLCQPARLGLIRNLTSRSDAVRFRNRLAIFYPPGGTTLCCVMILLLLTYLPPGRGLVIGL